MNQEDMRSQMNDDRVLSPLRKRIYRGGEPIKTRRQLTPIETMRPVEICAHINALRGEQLHRTLRGLVQRLITHPLNQNWFNAPVDPIALGIPDYFNVIKHPADLGTIKSKLANLEYPDVLHFAAEVRLVFTNATTYNPPTNAVHCAAVEMLKDFESELEKSVSKAQRATQRVDEHACGLCQGKQCVLCGEKCLTFEAPALVCCGPCGQKIRRDQFYHVTRDGSRLWCHKCYLGLKAIIPPPTEAYYTQSHVEPDETILAATAPNNNADVADQSTPEEGQHTQGDGDEEANPTPHTNTQGTLWYKRDLIKRKFDDDLAEPWVQCDACSRWLHQTCALFNAKAEADSGLDGQRFVCPLCELQLWNQSQSCLLLESKINHVDDNSEIMNGQQDVSEGGSSSAVPAPRNEEDEIMVPKQRPLKLADLTPTRLVLDVDTTVEFVIPQKSEYIEVEDTNKHVEIIAREDDVVEIKLRNGRSWHTAAVDKFDDDENEAEYAGVGYNAYPNQNLKRWWSARSLPRTRMSDHIEEAIRRRMRTIGDSEALRLADTVCVRVLSAVPQSLRVPPVIRANFTNSDGGMVPEVLPFESRAIGLFQRTDGIDLCVFAMYVHEFGDQGSEGPSAKRVYLAYLDSVEYFRPRTARTAIYHELIAAYFDWCRKRGFQAAHIWACPPQRGNNFIFWCHPLHQRTPSRERLGEWYKAMIKRAIAVGAVAYVRNLYDDHFVHLDEQRRRRPSTCGAKNNKTRLRHVDSLCSVESQSNVSNDRLLDGLPWERAENNNDMGSIHTGPENDNGSIASFAQHTTNTLPLCPPLFDGDYWPEEAIRLHGIIERRRGSFASRGGANHPYAGSLRSSGEASIAQQLEVLLKFIAQQPSAYPFMRPVDPVLLGIPDYLTVIQNPMDLGTIETKLRDGAYKIPQEFIDDLRLVFSNAQRYNPPAHPVHEAASHLNLILEKRLQALLVRLKSRCKATDARDILTYFPLDDSESTRDCAATLAANKAALLAQACSHQNDVKPPGLTVSIPVHKHRPPPESPRTRNRCSLDQYPDKVPPVVTEEKEEEDESSFQPPGPPRVMRTSTEITAATREVQSSNTPCTRLPIELAPSVFKMKDALFVLYLQPANEENDQRAQKRQMLGPGAERRIITSRNKDESTQNTKVKPGRKRRFAYTPVLPSQEIPEAIASDAEFYRSSCLVKDGAIVDPDAGALISSSLLDSRHTFLEMCQFWNYQFDSFRRAKHSSAMLLYHLHNPRVDSLRILCSHCSCEIRRIRWHCATCVDYNICRDCEKIVRATHLHTLTPYRISFTRRRQLTTSG
mmetsp:Transcript_6370/g.8973  ORF Transcript_6370/g.8973 Transcript_6370/m.8973 type:complete len:1310 (+) Transcript_6370:347-4276(+)